MSRQDMEMQFADPDWQPASSRPGHSPGEPALAVPVEIKYAPDPSPQADEPMNAASLQQGSTRSDGPLI